MTVLIAYVCMIKFNYGFTHVIIHVRFFSSRAREFQENFLLKLYIKGFTIRENLHLGIMFTALGLTKSKFSYIHMHELL